jgi:hypothetical protein
MIKYLKTLDTEVVITKCNTHTYTATNTHTQKHNIDMYEQTDDVKRKKCTESESLCYLFG